MRCGCQPAVAQRGEPGLQLGVEGPGPHVDHGGDPQVADAGVAHLAGQLGHRREQLRRQVVDDVPAEVLEDVGGRRPAGTAHPGDDDEVGRPGHRRQAAAARARRQPLPAPSARPAPSSSTTSPVARLTAGMLSAPDPNCAATTAASAGPMPGHGRELVDRGRPDPLDRPELLEQRLAPLLAQARDAVELARRSSPCDRRWRWKVIANRCASSRSRCSR